MSERESALTPFTVCDAYRCIALQAVIDVTK